MYTVHKNVQVILALLKEHGIRHLVLSAGTRHIPLVFSAEDDDYFKCYSVVDERSAGFFAIGLIQTLNEPVAIVCTSGTAACNYVSAVNEAYYQHLPLVVLTSDRHQYFLNQQEDQCLPQLNLFKDVCRKIVNLPIVRDDRDFWYCSRLVNEALLELDHRERGPVHINFQIDDNYPVELGTFKFEEKELPPVRKIERIMPCDNDEWTSIAEKMRSRKVLLMYGQHLPISSELSACIENFAKKYNVTIICDHLSNLKTETKIDNAPLFSNMKVADWDNLRPDIVITMNAHMVINVKPQIRRFKNEIEHWHVSPDGEVSDPFMCMTKIIECKPEYFFERLSKSEKSVENTYFAQWKQVEQERVVNPISQCKLEFSAAYAVKNLFENIPEKSLLHISNSNSIRIANMFPLKDTIDVYCNRGTCGIDGSMSSYIAQSYVTDKPSFMVIGDLSFFYDMNALWNRFSTKNTRIMLCNNSGGALFHSAFYKKVQEFDNIDIHIAASHDTSAEGWAKSRGFTYYSAHNKEEYDAALKEFVSQKAEQPILFEVFTDKEHDIKQINVAVNSVKSEADAKLHNAAKILPDPIKSKLKSILKK